MLSKCIRPTNKGNRFGKPLLRKNRSIRLFGCLASIQIVIYSGACQLQAQVPSKQATRSFERESDIETYFKLEDVPRWDGGYLLGYLGNLSSAPTIYSISRTGKLEQILFTLKDAAQISLNDIAASPDGEIVVVGTAVSADSRAAAFLARVSADRTRQVVTQLWPYFPSVLTVTPDGTVWTIGQLKDEANIRVISKDVLRRFDSSGRLLGSKVLEVRGTHLQHLSFLRSSRSLVGWFTRDGQYLEFGLDGAELGRYDGPQGIEDLDSSQWKNFSLTLTSDGEVVLAKANGAKPEMFLLDRSARTWKPVTLPEEQSRPWRRILGADGNTVVTNGPSGRLGRFRTR